MRPVDADEIIRETDKVRYLRHIYIHQLMDRLPKTDAIPVDWLRERASRMLDFGEGVERIIQEWQDEQSK